MIFQIGMLSHVVKITEIKPCEYAIGDTLYLEKLNNQLQRAGKHKECRDSGDNTNISVKQSIP